MQHCRAFPHGGWTRTDWPLVSGRLTSRRGPSHSAELVRAERLRSLPVHAARPWHDRLGLPFLLSPPVITSTLPTSHYKRHTLSNIRPRHLARLRYCAVIPCEHYHPCIPTDCVATTIPTLISSVVRCYHPVRIRITTPVCCPMLIPMLVRFFWKVCRASWLRRNIIGIYSTSAAFYWLLSGVKITIFLAEHREDY